MIQWITRIRLIEQKYDSINDIVQIQYRLPVFAQNVQAHIALQINVRVVYLCMAMHFRCLMRI